MGYELSLHAVPKFGTFEEMKNTFNYIEWKSNPWNFEVNEHSGEAPYPTYEEYWKNFVGQEDEAYPGEPTPESVFFYLQYDREQTVINYWCSVGRTFLDTFLIDNLTEIGYENYLVDKEFIDKAKEWAGIEYCKYELKEVTPIKSIKILDDDSEVLSKIDGIVIGYDEDRTRNVYNEYDCVLYSDDIDGYYCFSEFISALKMAEILLKADYFVWFERSY